MDLKAIFHINYIVIMQYITNIGNNNWKKPTQTEQNTEKDGTGTWMEWRKLIIKITFKSSVQQHGEVARDNTRVLLVEEQHISLKM
jgi:hypothetical protein